MSGNGVRDESGSRTCRPYCNVSGYYSDGFSCYQQFCCGNSSFRFCCSDFSRDISSLYPEKCNCPLSSCSKPSWDIVLPSVASAVFVFLMVVICCCHGCRQEPRCRQWLRFMGPETQTGEPNSSVPDRETGQDIGIDLSIPHQLPPYDLSPPKYDSLEMTEAPPKYEEAMRQQQQQQQQYDNIAFVGDGGSTCDADVTPDVTRHSNVTHRYDVIHDRNSPRSGEFSANQRIEIENRCSASQGQSYTSQGQDYESHYQGYESQGQGYTPQSQGYESQGQDCRIQQHLSLISESGASRCLPLNGRDAEPSSEPQTTVSVKDLETTESHQL